MPEYAKALIYILIVSTPAFILAKKIAVPFIEASEFRLWRNCWFIATCSVFLSGDFHIFALVMIAMSVYIHKNSNNPLSLYIILMFVAPCVDIVIGIPGVFGKIIDLNTPRLLTMLILVPVAAQQWQDRRNRDMTFPDVLIGAFVILLCLLTLRYQDLPSIIRVGLKYVLDIAVPYFVFSRALKTSRDINLILLAFAVAVMPLAMIGMFEIAKNWRLYNSATASWGVQLATPYLFRDGLLRAAVTAIEPISFGFVCMMGAGCLLALRTNQIRMFWRVAAFALLFGGLLSSVSRGPWLGFAFCCLIFALGNLKLSVKLFFALLVPAAAAAFAFSSRLDRFINLLPFVGNADPGSETYRSALFSNAMIVIERYPFFGSLHFAIEPEMQRMIQGQGIIDIVNSYLQIALEFGLVSLSLFAGFFACIAIKLVFSPREAAQRPVSNAGILGVLLGMLFTISTTSSVSFIPHIYWIFSGLCVALFRMAPVSGWASEEAFASAGSSKRTLSPYRAIPKLGGKTGKVHVIGRYQ